MNKVMGEDSSRQFRRRHPAAPRSQVPDQPPQRRPFPDKAAAAAPIDHVDLGVNLDEARMGGGFPVGRLIEPAEAAIAQSGKMRQQIVGDPVPGRRQHRQKLRAEHVLQPLHAHLQPLHPHCEVEGRRKLAVLGAGRRMAPVADPVLQHEGPRPIGQEIGKALRQRPIGGGRNDRQRHGPTGHPAQFGKGRCRRHRVIVAPPQGRRLTDIGPQIHLAGKIVPIGLDDLSHGPAPPAPPAGPSPIAAPRRD